MSGVLYRIGIICLVALLSKPGVVAAKDGMTGTVTTEAGITDLDKESFKHGEYDGIENDGLRLKIDANLLQEEDKNYLRFSAEDIGHESAGLSFEKGKYGEYEFSITYDQLIQMDRRGKTPYSGVGGDTITLPASLHSNFADTTAMLADPAWTTYDEGLKLKRKTATLGYKRQLREDISFGLTFKRENKEGIRSLGGPLGTSGRWTASVILPEPVDYTTDELNASVEYNKDGKVLQFNYFLSQFRNDHESLTWDNPFSEPGGDPYPDTASTSLPPDNEHQRIGLTGAFPLPKSSRLSFIAEYGEMEQEETLLPYTVNSGLTVPAALPRDDADAQIDVTHLTMNLYTRAIPKLSVNAKYRYYKTENKTPRDLFLKVHNDTGDNDADADDQKDSADETAAYNMPVDYEQNQFKLDATYRLLKSTRLKLGFEREEIDRDYREVDKTEEDTYSIGLNSTFSPSVSAGVNYAKADRDIEGGYDNADVYNAYHTAAYGTYDYGPAGDFDDHELMRKYDIAERDQTKYGANVTLLPTDNATLALYYNYEEDDYDESAYGLQEREAKSYTVDLTTAVSKDMSVYVFYTNEKTDWNQASISFRGGGPGAKYTNATNLDNRWWAEHEDDHDTFGVGSKMNILGGLIALNVDYTYAKSVTETSFTVLPGNTLTFPPGVYLDAEDLPDLKTKLHALNITGEYRYDKKLSVGVGYSYERYTSDDWATDSIDAASSTVDEVLSLYGSTPDYKAHLVKIYVTCKM